MPVTKKTSVCLFVVGLLVSGCKDPVDPAALFVGPFSGAAGDKLATSLTALREKASRAQIEVPQGEKIEFQYAVQGYKAQILRWELRSKSSPCHSDVQARTPHDGKSIDGVVVLPIHLFKRCVEAHGKGRALVAGSYVIRAFVGDQEIAERSFTVTVRR